MAPAWVLLVEVVVQKLEPTWVPRLAPLPVLPAAAGDPRTFEMADLLRYAVPDQAARF